MRLRQTIRATITPCNTLDIRSSGQELPWTSRCDLCRYTENNKIVLLLRISKNSFVVVLELTSTLTYLFILHSSSSTSSSSSSSGAGGGDGNPLKRSGAGGGCGEDIAWEVFYDFF